MTTVSMDSETTHSLGSVDALVLVGGLGTRLRATLGESTPKPLAPINGRPFLWYLLRYISREGLSRVVLATSHLSQSFQDQLATFAPDEIEIGFSFEKSPRGTGGAIVEALPQIGTDPFFVLNGDSFVDVPLTKMLEFHRDRGAVITLALARVEDSSRFGTVFFDEAGRIEQFREKMNVAEPGWINAGIYIVSKHALDRVLDLEVSSLERDVFPAWSAEGLYGFQVEAPFIDIGVPESYQASTAFFEGLG